LGEGLAGAGADCVGGAQVVTVDVLGLVAGLGAHDFGNCPAAGGDLEALFEGGAVCVQGVFVEVGDEDARSVFGWVCGVVVAAD
jgi:hypothetical protein